MSGPVLAETADTKAGGLPSRRPRGSVFRYKRFLALWAGLAALLLLTTGVLSDLHVRSELRQARTSLKTTRSHLALVMRNLSSTQAVLLRTAGQRSVLQAELTATAHELVTAQASLSSTQTGLSDAERSVSSQGVDIAVLNSCLGGVEQALNEIAVGDDNGAVTSISAVSESCQALQGGGKGGPVFPFDFPDPDVIRVGSIYYGYATNSAAGNIQMIQSTDLVHWTVDGNALPHIASWARTGATWAPGVLELQSTFVLYYAAVDGLTGEECISAAVATDPRGPFVDNSNAPLECQLDLGGSIDPSPFFDATGTPYLVWKSQGANGQPPTIWSQQLTTDGTAVAGGNPQALLTPSQPWEGGVVEGPFVLPWSGRYYIFYSANNWNSANYAIGVAVCQGPTGPCTKPLDHSIVVSQGAAMSGPGGPSLFTDTQGKLWIAFHAWLPSAVGYPNSRLLFLRQVTFTNNLPVVQSVP